MVLPLFYSKEPISADFITLDEDTSRHVVQVLRMKTGDQLEVTDGRGHAAIAAVVEEHKKKCTVRVSKRNFFPRSPRDVSIAISLLKNSTRFEWFLEKAIEIGVSEIIPLLCDRTEKQHFRLERMQTIAISAMLQSRQYWLPELREVTAFKNLVEEGKYAERFIAHCDNDERIQLKLPESGSCRVLIGPEGDFRRSEIDLALEHGYKPCMLGTTRLRSETAGIVAATLLCIS